MKLLMRWLVKVATFSLLAAGLWSTPAAAGCDIHVTVRNTTPATIYIHKKNIKAKAKGGTWRKLDRGGWFDGVNQQLVTLPPGGSYGHRYQATFGGCNTRRRYRIGYACVGSAHVDRVEYSPSPTGWVRTTDLQVHLTRPC